MTDPRLKLFQFHTTPSPAIILSAIVDSNRLLYTFSGTRHSQTGTPSNGSSYNYNANLAIIVTSALPNGETLPQSTTIYGERDGDGPL